MCYLIAKRYGGHGCIATQKEYGLELASLVDYLERRKEGTDVQILTISSKEAFGEYQPYEDCSESEFITRVLAM